MNETFDKKVIVGLSGGVDSSVCAMLLADAGYNVVGVNMSIYDKNNLQSKVRKNACYGCDETQDILEAQNFAESIGIPFYVFSCAEDYKKIVLAYFREEYLSGRTPNPCIKCNQLMKFQILPQMAKNQGINYDYFATGHYARIYNDNGWLYLQKAIDETKDQTYFLYRLNQEQLKTILFPLGEYSKEQIRKIAKKRGLKVFDKPDSQDFYSGDYSELLGVSPKKGNIVLKTGEILGQHNGFWNFTLGQRKGLGIAYPRPLYVLELNAAKNEVVVGEEELTFSKNCLVNDLTFNLPDAFVSGEYDVKFRSTQKTVKAYLELKNQELQVTFATPQKAVALGQSLVIYKNDLLIGGGVIARIN